MIETMNHDDKSNNKVHKKEILSLAKFDKRDGVKLLFVKGTSYEMGYQHGFLLSTAIELMVTKTLLCLPAYISTLIGICFGDGLALAYEGQEAAQPHIPEECLEEMKGITDGATDAGAANISLKQIMLWNSYYDQWCIYCHPHYWQSKSAVAKFSKKKHGSLVGSVGCSSFSVWGEWAGNGGKLVFGKNEDNFNMPFQLESRMVVVAKPNVGNGHMFCTFPGLLGLDGGLNDQGLQVMTQLNSTMDETMAGCGIGVFTRLLLSKCTTVCETVAMLEQTPRCGGIAWHVADGKAKQAAIIETSSRRVCIRYPSKSVQALWQSNHSNCHPGWEDYEGYNMVKEQQAVNELAIVDTIENWQKSLRDPSNIYVQAPCRFERYRQLITAARGNISVATAMDILSDRYDPYTQHTREKLEVSPTNNVGCTICALYPNVEFPAPFSNEGTFQTFHARIANIWSMVSTPETGDFWLAITDFPAQYGGYRHFHLQSLLGEL